RRHAAPALVVPLEPTVATPVRPHSSREVFPAHRAPPSVSRATPAPAEPMDLPDVQYVSRDDEFTRRTTPTSTEGETDVEVVTPIDGPRIRLVQPEEGTLEFLPGRLEVVSGDDMGQEIHFARRVGDEDTSVTFGRSDGPPLRHVQLLDPTVSRLHARMNFSGGRWHLTNLSHTNPVVLNGTRLGKNSGELTLADGDRIEMGNVAFVFRSQ
ncbi:MAG TPA: FHA domain-containing protein, partial [Gemmatimonadaceae bacterium]